MANSLFCPFLNDDPVYALGVEFGLLCVRMEGQESEEIADYFCRDNQEQILLAANRFGWRVEEIKPWDKHWFWCHMIRRR